MSDELEPTEMQRAELAVEGRAFLETLRARNDERRGVVRKGRAETSQSKPAVPSAGVPCPPQKENRAPAGEGPKSAAERIDGARARRRAERAARDAKSSARIAGLAPLPPPRPPASTAARRRRLSRSERLHRARAKDDRHAQRTIARWRERLAPRVGELRASEFRTIPRHVFETTWAVIADASGEALRAALRLAPNSAAKTALLRAALGMVGTSTAAYRFAGRRPKHVRSRGIAAMGLAMLLLARRTRRRGAWGGGEVVGIPRGAFCELLRDVNDPTNARPCVTTLFGTHRPGATAASGEVGYFVALREAGFAYRRQLPRAKAYPEERVFGGDWATNRYELCASAPERCSERFRRALLERIGLLLAVQGGREALETYLAEPARPPD